MGRVALIGLGSNVGDRKSHLDTAVARLAAAPGIEVRVVSSYHETKPVGGPEGQGAFLNAAAALETILEPESLLRALQVIELRAGEFDRSGGARGLLTSIFSSLAMTSSTVRLCWTFPTRGFVFVGSCLLHSLRLRPISESR